MPTQMIRLATRDIAPLSLIGLDKVDNPVVVADASWRILYANAGFIRLFGHLQESADTTLAQLLAALQADNPPLADEIHRLLANNQPVHAEGLLYAHDGQPHWYSAVTSPVLDAQGGLANIVLVLTDITATKVRETIQNTMLEALAIDRPMADVMDTMCREIERMAPDVAVSVLGVDEAGKLHPIAAPSLPAAYTAALEGIPIGPRAGSCGTSAFLGEPVTVTDIATDPLWTPFGDLARLSGMSACWSTPIHGSNGKVLGTFAFYYRTRRGPDAFHYHLTQVCTHLCTLAFERDAAREQIRWRADHDSLTGLPNRQWLRTRFEEAVLAAQARHERLALLFIDIDGFKGMNDALGTQAGDHLLQEIAQRIDRHSPPGAIVGRRSGDEFAILVPGCDAAAAMALAERLRAALAEPLRAIPGRDLSLSASLGLSLMPTHGNDNETLIRHTDLAVREAKQSGRNQVRLFSPDLAARALERADLEQSLKRALGRDELRLYYQPKLWLRDGALAGVEALARWRHPELGDVSPARFIPLAEDCGLVVELSSRVLHQACRQLARWRAEGLHVPTVSVNLSPFDFRHRDLPDVLQGILAQYGLAGHDLTIELTEGSFMESRVDIQETLAAVRALGVRMSMDDFGTGYSSLGQLLDLPFDELKLDQSFVRGLQRHDAARTLVEAAIRIGHCMGLKVVAEGVETEAQRTFLARHGCEIGQGYLFARPMAAAALPAWLAQAGSAA